MQNIYTLSVALPRASNDDIIDAVECWALGAGSAVVAQQRIGEREQPDGRRFRWEHVDDDATDLALETGLHVVGSGGLPWRTTVTASRVNSDDAANVTVRIARGGESGVIAPTQTRFRAPRLAADLVGLGAYRGRQEMTAVPTTVHVGDVAAFVDGVLRDEARDFPVFVLAVPAGVERPIVDAQDLARQLAGLANVYVLGGHFAWEALRDAVGVELRVPGGGAKLYWPRWPAAGQHHPWWPYDRLRQEASAFVEHQLRHVASLSVIHTAPDPVISRLQTAARSARLARAAAEDPGELDRLLDELQAESDAVIDELQADLDRVRLELEEKSTTVYNLQLRLRSGALGASGDARVAGDDPEHLPDPEDWVTFAAQLPSLECEAFRLTKKALKALSSTYNHPDRMWRELVRLRRAIVEWSAADGSVGDQLERWLKKQQGVDVAFSDGDLEERHNKGSVNLRFSFEGQQHYGLPHLRLGSNAAPDDCGRAYFAVDDDHSPRRVIVDHIGGHL